MAFSKWLFKDRKIGASHERSLTLSDVVRGLQFCANSSTQIAEQHYTTTLDNYLDKDNKPYTKRVYLDQERFMDVPLLCLMDHNSLAIDKMKVKMNVNIRDMTLKETDIPVSDESEEVEEQENTVSRSSMIVDMCNVTPEEDGTALELEFTFKVSQPPESFSRIMDTLSNSIAVQVLQKEE